MRIGRQGEIRDRTTKAQHFRIAGLNLLAAIIIYWNTEQLGRAVQKRNQAGLKNPENLLRHTSPLGWYFGETWYSYNPRRRRIASSAAFASASITMR